MQKTKKLVLKFFLAFLLFSQSIYFSSDIPSISYSNNPEFVSYVKPQEKKHSFLASETYEYSLRNNTYSAFFLIPQEGSVAKEVENYIDVNLKEFPFEKDFSYSVKLYNKKIVSFRVKNSPSNKNKYPALPTRHDTAPFGLCYSEPVKWHCFFYDRAAYVVNDIYNSTSIYRNSIEQVFPWENKIDFMEIVKELCEKEFFDASMFFFYQAIIHAPFQEEAMKRMSEYKLYLTSPQNKEDKSNERRLERERKKREKVKLWIDGRIAQRISDTGKADGIQDLILRIAGWILSSEKTESVSIEDMEENHKKMEENYKKYDIPTNRTMSWDDSQKRGAPSQDMLNLFSPHIFFRPYNKDLVTVFTNANSLKSVNFLKKEFENIYSINVPELFKERVKGYALRRFFLRKKAEGRLLGKLAKLFFSFQRSEEDKTQEEKVMGYAQALQNIMYDSESLHAQELYLYYLHLLYTCRCQHLIKANNKAKGLISLFQSIKEISFESYNNTNRFLPGILEEKYFPLATTITRVFKSKTDFEIEEEKKFLAKYFNEEPKDYQNNHPFKRSAAFIVEWEKEYFSAVKTQLYSMSKVCSKLPEKLKDHIKLLDSHLSVMKKYLADVQDLKLYGLNKEEQLKIIKEAKYSYELQGKNLKEAVKNHFSLLQQRAIIIYEGDPEANHLTFSDNISKATKVEVEYPEELDWMKKKINSIETILNDELNKRMTDLIEVEKFKERFIQSAKEFDCSMVQEDNQKALSFIIKTKKQGIFLFTISYLNKKNNPKKTRHPKGLYH